MLLRPRGRARALAFVSFPQRPHEQFLLAIRPYERGVVLFSTQVLSRFQRRSRTAALPRRFIIYTP